MTIGEHIKQLRKRAYLSVSDLSKISNVSIPTIYKIERDEQNIDLSKIADVCDALDRKVKMKLVKK